MKTYIIPCTWTMYGRMMVEAKTLKDATELAYNDEPLPGGDYLEDSFEVDYEALHHYNDEDVV